MKRKISKRIFRTVHEKNDESIENSSAPLHILHAECDFTALECKLISKCQTWQTTRTCKHTTNYACLLCTCILIKYESKIAAEPAPDKKGPSVYVNRNITEDLLIRSLIEPVDSIVFTFIPCEQRNPKSACADAQLFWDDSIRICVISPFFVLFWETCKGKSI